MKRCAHGFPDGVCVVRECPHFDGIKPGAPERRTIVVHRGRRTTRVIDRRKKDEKK